jgi:acyl-CoA thioesterase
MIWLKNCWVGVKQQSLTQTFKQIYTIEYRNMASFLRFKVNLLRRENHLVVSNELNTRFELWVPGVWTVTRSLHLNMLSLAVLSSFYILLVTINTIRSCFLLSAFYQHKYLCEEYDTYKTLFHLISSLAV